MFGFAKKLNNLLPSSSTIAGHAARTKAPAAHFVNRHRLEAPFPEGMQLAKSGSAAA